tara:strand:+ start:6139 stop:6423 length:285 start_codon:yes stop_codon:yes gene_type:complete
MPQTQPQEVLSPQDEVGPPSDPMAEIYAALNEFASLFSEQQQTPEEDVVTQEIQEVAPPPVAQEKPPPDETNAEARLRAARSAIANNPFAGRTA